ncbi:MAG: Rrf2 family transcriptional regulator [Legionellales bacterium]|nr:Rrf2 family transcriptional regulator [Legionellales bacterium]
MQLNRRTDYALRTLLYLAIVSEERLSTLDEIAAAFHIARDHLIKIVNKLAKLKFITTQRGKGGGIKINLPTLENSIYEIITHFESTLKVIDCEHPICPIKGICRLNVILDEASSDFSKVLKKYKLKDILPQSSKEQKETHQKLNISIVIENKCNGKRHD